MTPTALCAMLAGLHLQVFIGLFRGRAGSKVNLKADKRPPNSLQSSLHSNQTAWEASEGPASAAPGCAAGEAEACSGPELDARLLTAMSIELTGACSSSSVHVQRSSNGANVDVYSQNMLVSSSQIKGMQLKGSGSVQTTAHLTYNGSLPDVVQA